MRNEPVLCYVREPWAYFTTQPLEEQWGDDWNDAPYEHNAGRPYTPCWHNEPKHVEKRGGLCTCRVCDGDWNEDGTPAWEIIQVAYEGPFDEPLEGHHNSPFSVESINGGAVPWLRPSRWSDQACTPPVSIMAGVTLLEFCELMRKAGGTVYLATEFPHGIKATVSLP